jgi:AraC-like DNA-binding protein
MQEMGMDKHFDPADRDAFSSSLKRFFGPLDKGAGAIRVEPAGPSFRGRVELNPVRPGVRLFSMDLDVRRDVDMEIEPVPGAVFITLVLDGQSEYTVRRATGYFDPWAFKPGRCIAASISADHSRWRIPGGGPQRLVELHLSPGGASRLLAEYRESGSNHSPALIPSDGSSRRQERMLPPELGVIARQILDCPLEGPARRLYMESKALEILSLQLAGRADPTLEKPSAISRADRLRLEEARCIVEREFANPPSLLALALRVGLNDFKLKRGFRELFHTTVFGYARMLRLEKAKELMETEEMTVSEAASAMGYTCFGHFAQAFRKRFGLLPRDFKKTRETI